MPNPLSALMSSPGAAAANPDAAPQQARLPDGAASFQMVMDQETDPQSVIRKPSIFWCRTPMQRWN